MSGHKIGDYLKYFFKQEYLSLFDNEINKRLENVRSAFGRQQTEETILEVHLSDDSKRCDYSFRVNTESKLVKNYWYELDYEACVTKDITPCYFIDSSVLKPGASVPEFYESVFPKFAGEKRAKMLSDRVKECVEKLDGLCEGLFQIGVMMGRGQKESVRIFTSDMKRENLLEYLQKIDWQGDVSILREWLGKWEDYSGNHSFILDFDLYEEGISDKIGICFGLRMNDRKAVTDLLSYLESEELCLPEKGKDVVKFIDTFPYCEPFIQNDISRFKFPFENGKVLGAKVYLRQGSKCFMDFRAYYAPVIMNLELTSRCPLHCPQCYCDLDKGKDLDVDKALRWLADAARCGVDTINLSGGETMCYPHLNRLIEFCKEHGMNANVAFSGWGITEESLKTLIDSGVYGIFISLNGSTEEINKKSRDGYQLAIHALELLQKIQFANTHINWVMHSFNADDFKNILKLAENYNVSKLVVMVFKPNAAHELPSVPTKEQIMDISKVIREYKGTVEIEVEGCFSQLRAVRGQRFFTNINQGIGRGCGAGRDGISISADGRLTPCRHLEIEEDWKDIMSYWNHSNTIKELRKMEDGKEEPCSKCSYKLYCLPCAAVNHKQKGRIFMGDTACPIRPE